MKKGKRIGLALSGGGYRAAAYHIGALRALYNMGLLSNVDCVSSVSGGSITAAYYALNGQNFQRFEETYRKRLKIGVLHLAILNVLVVLALMAIAVYYLKYWGIVLSLFALVLCWYKLFPVSCLIATQYDWLFFGFKKLKDLPKMPLVTINATDFPTVSLLTFSREKIYNYYYGEGAFYHESFPISMAVMASSCVPFAFNPIRIPNRFKTGRMKGKESPLLLDGGLYDNQGTHVLTDKMSPYNCDCIIVSDAGNGKVSGKRVLNPFITLKRTSEVFMQRIKKIQMQQNVYLRTYSDKRFAYANLEWDVNDRLLQGFVDNLKYDNIYKEVIDVHGISEKEIAALKNSATTKDTRADIVKKLKKSIKWDELEKIRPSEEEHAKAFATGTWLFGMSAKRISMLSKEAEWKVMVQVRLYLPFLLNE